MLPPTVQKNHDLVGCSIWVVLLMQAEHVSVQSNPQAAALAAG